MSKAEDAATAVEQAIGQAVSLHPRSPDQNFLGAWIVVAQVVDASDGLSEYLVVHANGQQPYHIAYGLLKMGEQTLDEQLNPARYDGIDDE